MSRDIYYDPAEDQALALHRIAETLAEILKELRRIADALEAQANATEKPE